MDRRKFGMVMLGMLCSATAGCSGKNSIDTVPVSGTVTRNGDPIANATVVFNPVSSGPLATGVTDESGRFTLKTNKLDGAQPGEYKITVSPNTPAIDANPPMPGTKEYAEAQKNKSKPPFPEKYRRVDSTTLKETVEKGGNNEFELKLDD